MLSCKYSENGCKASGTKAFMQEQADSCLFAKIQCPLNRASCKEIMLKSEVIIHLKNVHKLAMWNTYAYGKVMGRWTKSPHQNPKEYLKWLPAITSFDGNTFLFNAIQLRKRGLGWSRSFWVSVVGSEKVAKKYEVKICTSDNGENKAWHGNIGKVYSTDTRQEDVLEDNKGVLELSKKQIEKLEIPVGEEYDIELDFEIIRK